MKLRLLAPFAALAAILSVSSAQAEEKVVNVYNWSDYISKDVLTDFTAETGIKVKYDTYGDNEILDAKLMTGKSGYDVVFPSASPFFAQQIKAGVYRKLDFSKIPNATGMDKAVMASLDKVDPGNAYGLPYMMAATGIGYNVDAVAKLMPDAPVDSWRMLFDEAVVSKLKPCGVTLLDSPTEVVPAVLAYLGQDPTSQTSADLDKAMAALTPLRKNYRYLNSERYRADLASGDICVAHGYVGDLVQSRARAKEAKKNPAKIAITIPKEGAMVNVDVMAVPADAPHAEAAFAFINYLLRPEVIARITNEIGYANAVPASLAFVDPAIKTDPAIYPPPEIQAKLFPALPPANKVFDRARTHAWSKFRAARN